MSRCHFHVSRRWRRVSATRKPSFKAIVRSAPRTPAWGDMTALSAAMRIRSRTTRRRGNRRARARNIAEPMRHRPRSLVSPGVPEKRYLMTPGPTPAPPQVLAALAAPVIHHRARDYRELFEELLSRLGEVFQTRNDVLVYTCSGTGGMESAIANLCSPGERVLVVSAGYFGERFGEIARAYGCDVLELRYDWGETPSADDLRARIDETGPAVVHLTQSETSTGVVADVQ